MQRHDITLRQLRYFSQVVDAQNITRAAEQLHVAQPALGLTIRQLEDALGTPLLSRHSRGVDATPAGRLLYTRACNIFDILQQTRMEIAGFEKNEPSELTLGLTASLVMLIGTEAIQAAKDMLPSVALNIREDPSFVLVDAVENQEVDVALAYAVANRPKLQLTPVLREELLLVTRADQAPSAEVVSLEEALQRNMAHGGIRDAGRCTVALAAMERGLPFHVAYQMQSIAGIREMVLRGMAATVLPYGSVAREVASGQLAVRRIADCALTQTLYIVRHARESKLPALNDEGIPDFLRHLIQLIAKKQGPLACEIDFPSIAATGELPAIEA